MWPYLASKGFILYRDIFFIYPPLYFWLLAGFAKVAGFSLTSLQVFSYVIVAATDVLLYFAARKKIWPVVIYVFLQVAFEGNGMWPDQFLAPMFLLAYLALSAKRYFLLGLMLGLALITKQTAAYFIVAMALFTKTRVLAGITIPLAFLAIFLAATGSFGEFYDQTVRYILFYHAGNKLQQLWPTLGQVAVLSVIFLPAIAVGILRKKYLLVALTVAGSLGMFTRFSYFHLQPALPFLAILIADSWVLAIPAVLFFAKVMLADFGQPAKFLTPQILDNARVINQYIAPGEKTLILSSNDHYYFLTGTFPVGDFFTTSTSWNLAYPGIDEKITSALTADKPKFVVYEKGPENVSNFITQNYRLVLKLSDGTGIFEYNPVRLPQEVEP